MSIRSEVYKRDKEKSTYTQYLRNSHVGKKCPTCGTVMIQKTIYRPSLDHIVPISLGGNHFEENWRIICLSCNCSKRHNDWGNHGQ